MAASIPTVPKLRDFVLTEKLGSGTYATVYKAYRKGGQREVAAIKCIQKKSLNKASTENLLTEIELLKNLRHEHIVELKDFQWDDKHIYLIMEFCSGGDLSCFIRSRRALPEYIVKRFLQQLALALQYLRSKDVSHLDLKPQNILLSTHHQPILKIADFGFARYLGEDSDAFSLRGSPLYMAPEIICKRHYDARADLWSVGVILYECLFGRAPFASKSFKELEVKIRDSKPIEIPYGVVIQDSCRDLLLGLLKRNPDVRISFEDFFDHSFVDIDHAPSKDCFEKAAKLVTKAVEQDSKCNLKEAANLYCDALNYFVPAIHYERDLSRKNALRLKVQDYIKRAEELKQILKPTSSSKLERSSSSAKLQPTQELVQLCQDHDHLKAALKIISVAAYKDEKEDYKTALEQYRLALGGLIKIIADEPSGRRKEMLYKEVNSWMGRAEEIASHLNWQQLRAHNSSMKEEEQIEKHSMASSCSIQ